MNYKKPELIAPAGDWACLHSAIDGGADAVYFGVKELNMRDRARNFCVNELPKIVSLLHDAGKKAYLTLNTIIFNSELKKARKILQKAKDAGVDRVILWDMGLLQEAKAVGIPVHLSTQASVSNASSLKFYSEQGVKRVVLARECSIKDMRDIVKTIDAEKISCDIEVFVHGAMCVSLSGRCFLSQMAFSESANRGKCLQPCRREYLITDVEEPEHQYKIGKDYVLSPKDLCVIEYVDKLIKAGIGAFKIE
ncbi:MAG: peptidase U32 family protein, partial [Candidatus Omnitrophota bacterium]